MENETPDMVLMPMKDLLNMEEALNAPTFEEVKVIAYKPQIASFLGSIEAAIYFQQLSHWQKYAKRNDGFIYKSAKEIYEETYISEKIQRRCREQLSRLGWIEIEKKMANGHPTYHFRVIAKTFGVLMPTGNRPHDPVPTGERPVPIGQTASSITKNTTKNNNIEIEEQIRKLHNAYIIYVKLDPTHYFNLPEDKQKEIRTKAKNLTKLTPLRRKKITSRLNDAGYDMCLAAIKNIGQSDWHRDNHDGKWYAKLEWIMGSYEKVEEWASKEDRSE